MRKFINIVRLIIMDIASFILIISLIFILTLRI